MIADAQFIRRLNSEMEKELIDGENRHMIVMLQYELNRPASQL